MCTRRSASAPMPQPRPQVRRQPPTHTCPPKPGTATMTGTQPTTAIRTADPADADTITAVLTDAFLHSPIGDWLIPNPDIRRHVYTDYYRIHAEHALHIGLVDVAADENAVAVWFPCLED